ncbi:MAG: stalk domain-containing protein [Trueperaceae bacterium]|nr:stalk domain-containing protein [Trueperaceae bacterium]
MRRRRAPRAVLVLALALAGLGAAQTLRIDGRDLGPVRSDLLEGSAYAALPRVADAFGVDPVVDPETAVVTIARGGRVVRLDVVPVGTNPARAGALRLDGAAFADQAAVDDADATYVPVAALARALGGSVGYVAEADAVVVVTPRPTVQDVTLETTAQGEALRVAFDGPVAVRRVPADVGDAAAWRIPRAGMPTARSEGGALLTRVGVYPEDGDVRIRLDAEGVLVDAVVVRTAAGGSDVVIRARPDPSTFRPRGDGPPSVALHAASSPEPREVRAALLDLARRVQEALGPSDGNPVDDGDEGVVAATLVRTGAAEAPPAEVLRAAATSDVYLRLHAADVPAGEVRLWALGEVTDAAAVELAIRRNAARALEDAGDDDGDAAGRTDALRREILLGLVPDVELGQDAAERLADALFDAGGYRAGDVQRAPLASLAPAAGRGVLVEVAADALRDDAARTDLAAALATALRTVLQR